MTRPRRLRAIGLAALPLTASMLALSTTPAHASTWVCGKTYAVGMISVQSCVNTYVSWGIERVQKKVLIRNKATTNRVTHLYAEDGYRKPPTSSPWEWTARSARTVTAKPGLTTYSYGESNGGLLSCEGFRVRATYDGAAGAYTGVSSIVTCQSNT